MGTPESLTPQGERQCPGPLVIHRVTSKGPECHLGDGCLVRELHGEALKGVHIAVHTVTPTPEHLRRAIAHRRREKE